MNWAVKIISKILMTKISHISWGVTTKGVTTKGVTTKAFTVYHGASDGMPGNPNIMKEEVGKVTKSGVSTKA